MRRGVRRWIGLLVVCAFIPGCLLNSVHSISRAPWTKPDRAHAIVVIGMGLDETWPYSEFQLTFPEYSVEKQSITGNAFTTTESRPPCHPLRPRSGTSRLRSQRMLTYI